MPQTEERLKSPKAEVLKPLIAKIDQQINDGADCELTEYEAIDVVDVLRWVLTFLDNRKVYHKKRQFQNKAERQLLEEALRGKGVDVDAIKRRAQRIEADELVDSSIDE